MYVLVDSITMVGMKKRRLTVLGAAMTMRTGLIRAASIKLSFIVLEKTRLVVRSRRRALLACELGVEDWGWEDVVECMRRILEVRGGDDELL
jgi:hypothetical protein